MRVPPDSHKTAADNRCQKIRNFYSKKRMSHRHKAIQNIAVQNIPILYIVCILSDVTSFFHHPSLAGIDRILILRNVHAEPASVLTRSGMRARTSVFVCSTGMSGTVSAMFVFMMTALYIRVVSQAAVQQRFYRLIRAAGYTAVKLNACF